MEGGICGAFAVLQDKVDLQIYHCWIHSPKANSKRTQVEFATFRFLCEKLAPFLQK